MLPNDALALLESSKKQPTQQMEEGNHISDASRRFPGGQGESTALVVPKFCFLGLSLARVQST